MAFPSVVQIVLVFLAVLAVLTHGQVTVVSDNKVAEEPKLIEVMSGELKLSQEMLNDSPAVLVQNVLEKLKTIRSKLSSEVVTQRQVTEKQGLQNEIEEEQIEEIRAVGKQMLFNGPPTLSFTSDTIKSSEGQPDQVHSINTTLNEQPNTTPATTIDTTPITKANITPDTTPATTPDTKTATTVNETKDQKTQPDTPAMKVIVEPNLARLTFGSKEFNPGLYVQEVLEKIRQSQENQQVRQTIERLQGGQENSNPQQLEKQQLEQKVLGEQQLKEKQSDVKKQPESEQKKEPAVEPNRIEEEQQEQQTLTGQQSGNNRWTQGNKKKPQFNKNSMVNAQQKVITTNIPELGRVRGRLGFSHWTGKRIIQFFDIPYGQSPVGGLRFKPSRPVKPWTGILKANTPHPGCPSLQNMDILLNVNRKNVNMENCLRLSVSTKKFNSSAPVMVYIHGDSLYDGNSLEAAPGYMLEEDVVLVSLRYRLGPFGFLSTMSEEIPGNAAVHDVILALQWIQKHIAHFGGDPKRVTLFGQAGGAAMINILTMSPAVSENLFHRIILQSGSALSPAFVTEDPMPASQDMAKIAGCKDFANVAELNKCLLQLNTTELLEAFNEHSEANIYKGIGNYGGMQFVVGGPSGVLPEHPGKLMGADKFKAYPTMGGSVKNAGTFVLKDIFFDNFNESIPDDIYTGNGYIEYIINQTNGVDPTDAWRKYAEEEIFSADDIKNGSFHKMLPGLIDMCSTIAFKNPVLLALQANAKKLPNDTYLYSFDFAGERNRYESLEDDALNVPFDLGVSLTDENLYLFPWPQLNVISSNRDLKIAKRMVALWVSFASTGVPRAPGLPEWPTMHDDTGPYMKIGTTVAIADNYLDEYTVAVKDAQMGYSLVNEEFFESLEEINFAEKFLNEEVTDAKVVATNAKVDTLDAKLDAIDAKIGGVAAKVVIST